MSDESSVVSVTDPNNVQAAPAPEKPRDDAGKFAAKEQVQEVKQDSATETAQNVESKTEEKKPNRTGEFIDKLKRENWELRQMKAELEALKAAQPKPEAPKAPDPNTFYQDPAAFVQANSQYAVTQARQQWEQEQAAQREQEEWGRTQQTWQQKAAAFAAEHPDFEEKIYSVPEDLLPEDLARTIIAHERGHELAYHLANNWGELAQLASVAPQYRRYAIDSLVSKLDTRATATLSEAPPPAVGMPAKQVTRAPAPVTTLSGSPAVKKSYAQMTQKEYEAARKAERKAKGLRD
jgi:hypothetical protein